MIAMVPGSFDPIHKGHLDIIRRSLVLFERVLVSVSSNVGKTPLFSVAERVAMVQAACEGLAVDVMASDHLVVAMAREHGIGAIVRGLRNEQDFGYEYPMAIANQTMAPEVQTLFLGARPEYLHISASLIRELIHFGQDVSPMVPDAVMRRILSSPPV